MTEMTEKRPPHGLALMDEDSGIALESLYVIAQTSKQ
jgi:hypothetical protein